ncbi:MAG: alpha/beta fold hydrolase [Flavobacteriaceae bacterium]
MNFLDYKETQIAYYDTGKGAALVFLHGFLESKSFFDKIIGDFSKNYRCISIDLLGHGESGNIGYIHHMEDMADAVFAVLNHLKLRKIILIGHSMGGYVSLAFADLYPDHIRGICLLNSSSRADSEERKLGRDRAIEQIKKNHKSFIRIAIPQLFRPKNRIQFKEEIKQIKLEALKCSVQGIIAALEGMKIRVDREVILHFAPYPKLIITGKKDGILPLKTQIEQTIDNDVDLDILPDGHMSLIENYQETVYSLRRFIGQCLNP